VQSSQCTNVVLTVTIQSTDTEGGCKQIYIAGRAGTQTLIRHLPIIDMSLPPPSKLGRYRVLSPSCGLKVSPLQLGAMSIGERQAANLGSMDKKTAFELLDTYYDLGGNYLDTANGYQDEQR
jgi:hypothetical protein